MISVSGETDQYETLGYDDEHDEDALSPIDEMHNAGKKRNVLFEASAKEDGGTYERLRANISRTLRSVPTDCGS